MIKVLAAAAGFVVSLGMFAGGAGLAAWLLAAKPVSGAGPEKDQAIAWTGGVKSVNVAEQNFERLPGRVATASESAQPLDISLAAAPDTTTTASVPAEPLVGQDPSPSSSPALKAHEAWCADHFRSYRASDNSYSSYSGARRNCDSPYSGQVDASLAPSGQYDESTVDDGQGAQASVDYISADVAGGPVVSSEHARDCFSRYRSYRPEDNTYQPWGGGARRQCQ